MKYSHGRVGIGHREARRAPWCRSHSAVKQRNTEVAGNAMPTPWGSAAWPLAVLRRRAGSSSCRTGTAPCQAAMRHERERVNSSASPLSLECFQFSVFSFQFSVYEFPPFAGRANAIFLMRKSCNRRPQRSLPARISHRPSTTHADLLAVSGRTPFSRLDVVSATPSPSSGPCPRHSGIPTPRRRTAVRYGAAAFHAMRERMVR